MSGGPGAEPDVIPSGQASDGYKALAFTATGDDFPVFEDIKQYVRDAGKAAGAGDKIGTVQYNRAVYSAMLAAEAIRTAQEIHGVADITPAMNAGWDGSSQHFTRKNGRTWNEWIWSNI